ncbi:MAG: phosphatidylserine decarboxylase family protein [Bacteroidia bacterium]|nr:phosphatidylserine decarboxylase family protein [Bacteroidia bacterium]
MTLHREGRTILFIMLIVLVLINWGITRLLPGNEVVLNTGIGISIILYLLVVQFFRNPIFTVKKNPNQVLAPADGKVVVIEETEETEYLKDRRKQISIFMSPVNVHVNRSPVGGTVSFVKYHPGKYLVAWHPKSSTENERTTVVVKTAKNVEVLFRQIAGAVARRIKWYIHEGQSLDQGQEFGFIKFGSRVDIFLPLNARIKVSVGDKTKGGRTVLAEFE